VGIHMVPVEEITQRRLDRWGRLLCQAHATPVVLVGLGHDLVSGQIVLCTLDEPEMSRELICCFLRSALANLEST